MSDLTPTQIPFVIMIEIFDAENGDINFRISSSKNDPRALLKVLKKAVVKVEEDYKGQLQ